MFNNRKFTALNFSKPQEKNIIKYYKNIYKKLFFMKSRFRNCDSAENGRKLQFGCGPHIRTEEEPQKRRGPQNVQSVPLSGSRSRSVFPVRPPPQLPTSVPQLLREADGQERKSDHRGRRVGLPLPRSAGVAWRPTGCHDDVQRAG